MGISISINRRVVIYSALAAIGLWIAWINFRAGGFAVGVSALLGLVLWALIIRGVTVALKKYRCQYDSHQEPVGQEGESKVLTPAKGSKFNPVFMVSVVGLFLGISTALNKPSFWSVMGGLCWIGLSSFVAWIMYNITKNRYTDTIVTVRGVKHTGKSWLVSAYSPEFDQYIEFSLPEHTLIEVTQQICVLVIVRFRPYWNGQIVDMKFDSLVSNDLKGRISNTSTDVTDQNSRQTACTSNRMAARKNRVDLCVMPGGKK
ncbi:MAG: hypothetical protein A4E56_02249 [Pelotomaculum sp. PtaU1.Bin065]|nr:MAG: hypothetical protein A4E56_02249 [Pelotomaculum sp. PtaU1.Bin065]